MARIRLVGAPSRLDNPEPLPTRALAISADASCVAAPETSKTAPLNSPAKPAKRRFYVHPSHPRGYSRALGS